MNSITVVRNALIADARIEVVNEERNTYFPHPDGYWSQTFAFTVAPVEELYEAAQLQELMMSLVPLDPTTKDDFQSAGDSITFGKLYFDEQIGEMVLDEVKNYTITDPDFNGKGLVDGKLKLERHETIPLRRRTWVYLYPSVSYALRVLNEDAGKYCARREEVVPAGHRFRG